MNKSINETMAITTEACEVLDTTGKLIETLNELLGPVITDPDLEPDAAALAEIKRKCRMIDGTLLQIELNVRKTYDELNEIGGIAG